MSERSQDVSGGRRGMIGKGCLLGLGGVLLFGLLLGGCAVSKYNGIVQREEKVDSAWSEIHNQYKRRFDLVPQLVETVKGAADFERTTITEVTEARARVGGIQVPESVAEDPSRLEEFFRAQQALGGALQRLLVVAENYPNLKASQNFLALQDQLEGTENRIAVARRDYIESVRTYNVSIRTFPANFIASTFGFEKLPQLEFEEGVTETPAVDFNFGDG